MANGKQLSQKGAEEILDIIDSYIDVKEAVIKENKDLKIKYEQLGLRCNQLLKDKGDLTDKVIKLEKQIEKMRCCYNCAKWNDGQCEESPKSKIFFCADFICDNWKCFE